MKLIIAGSRNLDEEKLYSLFEINALLEIFNLDWPNEIVHGGCPKGTDKYAELALNGWDHVKIFPADWDKHGKAAGPIRNKEMALYADALLLIWDGKSKGSKSMKAEMKKLKKPIYEIIINEET